MPKQPPTPLVLAGVSYLGYLCWSLIATRSVVVGGVHLVLSAVLFFFVMRGSRMAARILAALCGLSALVLFVAAVATFQAQPRAAGTLTVMSGLLALFVAYLCRSDAMKRFQERSAASSSP
ncbi:hypothetical protein [Pseudomarimonas salicorniae]|uniref:Uncharacterized protein n=1 Tax=Pseudomarimonas salicorniae TaxID=2933270 RepID=A0ABT0GCS6_9GAMM|nr:hypothetical protein [Lysobacter sp. CAU 1642]MCK7592331.1 hypothetical protein [Lysobacter sp. CAU 1642]